MRPKNVKKYPDIIFETFEDAKIARKLLYSYTQDGAATVKFFSDILKDTYIKYKIVDNTGTEESKYYGWTKKGNIAIYEYEYNGKIYYILEDPVCLVDFSKFMNPPA